jgi:hypothetical protein
VGQGSVEVDGEHAEGLDALIEPPIDDVRLRTARSSSPMRSADATAVRRRLRRRAGWAKGKSDDWSDARRPEDGRQITRGALERVTLLLGIALDKGPGRGIDRRRRRVLTFVFGVRSPLLLWEREARVLISWLESNDARAPNDTAIEDCRRLLERATVSWLI